MSTWLQPPHRYPSPADLMWPEFDVPFRMESNIARQSIASGAHQTGNGPRPLKRTGHGNFFFAPRFGHRVPSGPRRAPASPAVCKFDCNRADDSLTIPNCSFNTGCNPKGGGFPLLLSICTEYLDLQVWSHPDQPQTWTEPLQR